MGENVVFLIEAAPFDIRALSRRKALDVNEGECIERKQAGERYCVRDIIL